MSHRHRRGGARSNGSMRTLELGEQLLAAECRWHSPVTSTARCDRLAVADLRLVELDFRLKSRSRRCLITSRCSSPMPLISVWPVSPLWTCKVGSWRLSISRVSGQLVAFGGAVRLDGHRDDRLGELDRSPAGSGRRVSQSVSPVIECRRPIKADDVAGPGVSTCSSRLRGVDAPQLRHVFLLVLAGIQHAACWPSTRRNRCGPRTCRLSWPAGP